jgi:hypothetical protein
VVGRVRKGGSCLKEKIPLGKMTRKFETQMFWSLLTQENNMGQREKVFCEKTTRKFRKVFPYH